jgi:hypothetical protein
MEQATRGQIKLDDKHVSSPNITGTKTQRKGWVGHTEWMKTAYSTLSGKFETKSPTEDTGEDERIILKWTS